MCYNPVKVVPKRYYTNVEFKGRFYESALYDGQIYNDAQRYCYYPCGKCYECREAKIEAWQIRWKEHLKTQLEKSSYMLTLTYSDENLKYENGRSSLCYRDVQLFLKRLRKRQSKIDNSVKLTYHGCGEYGTKYTKRPHYHILITNCIVDQCEFESIWQNGIVHVGDNVTTATIKYVLKYTLKNSISNEEKKRVVYENGDFKHNVYLSGKNKGRVCEKTFCSKGIGKSYVTPELTKYYHENPSNGYLWQDVKKNGQKISKVKPLPRYYKELIFNPNVIENGKIKRDDHDRPVKLYSPLSEDFEKTPRFKKMLEAYQAEKVVVNRIVSAINYYGYDNYLAKCRRDKYERHQKYYRELKIRENLQNSLNQVNGALLI